MATSRRVPLLALALLAAWLALPGAASANYAAPATIYGCENRWNGGGRDASGTLYMACAGEVRIVRADGTASSISIDPLVEQVAPSPDGRYLYSVDPGGAYRYVRTAEGYRRDETFTFQRPATWAGHPDWKVCGYGIATDAYGKIYVSNGAYCEGNPNEIIKYRPDGTPIATFGEYGVATKWVSCPTGMCVEWNRQGGEPGLFQPNTMLAVTADGSRVWIADQSNQRVQVFQRAANNVDYEFRTMWSGEGTAWSGQLGAVFGVAVDPWGYGYVTQTTTKQIWRLDPEARNPVLVKSYAGTSDWYHLRPHTVAVDARGRVFVGEWNARIDRTTPVPGPLPALPAEPRGDETAPVITSLTAPERTSEASVTVTIQATDDYGVTELRVAGEDRAWSAWRATAATIDVPLSAGLGTKTITVQVRDAAGRVSAERSVSVQRIAPPDAGIPWVRLAAPARSTSSTVQLTVDTGDDVAVTQIRFQNDAGTWTAWRAWTSGRRTVDHVLAAGTGTRRVSAQVRDAAQHDSPTAQVTILVEAPAAPAPTEPAPTGSTSGSSDPAPAAEPVSGGGSIVVEPTSSTVSGRDRVAPTLLVVRTPARTCTRRIVIRLYAFDDTRVRFVRVANDRGRFGAWRAYSPRLSHVLARGVGRHSVRVQVRDGAGNVSLVVTRRLSLVRC